MRTDELFYALFKLAPKCLFRLTGIPVIGDYIFESITVKSTEKRMDGFFMPTDEKGPNVFLEVQGYADETIYWRFFREIATWYEQNKSTLPFIAVVLFTDERFDPKNNQIACLPPSRLIVCNLIDCLKSLGEKASELTVLKPLAWKGRDRLPEATAKWRAEIESLNLPAESTRSLMELLEYAILQRFPKLTLKEIQKMIQLVPLEETVAGQELISIGAEQGKKEGRKLGLREGKKEGRKLGLREGKKEGIQKGRLMGEIRMGQRILGEPVSAAETLEEMDLETLEKMLGEIESRLNQS